MEGTIASRLKTLRESRGFSQQALADAAGVHVSVVFKIEQGQSVDPRISSLVALAKALGVSIAEFTEDDDAKTLKGVDRPEKKLRSGKNKGS
jgi:transcriptional regulator with XRE-family HTH domain